MIFGLSIAVIITLLLIIDVIILVVRFQWMQAHREARRAEFQAQMRPMESEMETVLLAQREQREQTIRSIQKTQELYAQLKDLDAQPDTQ